MTPATDKYEQTLERNLIVINTKIRLKSDRLFSKKAKWLSAHEQYTSVKLL